MSPASSDCRRQDSSRAFHSRRAGCSRSRCGASESGKRPRFRRKRASSSGTSNILPLNVTSRSKRAQLLRERVEQRRLLVVVAHEVLAHDEAVALHPADADQEGRGPGAAGEARRLGVEEDRAAQVEALELRLRR